MTVLPLTSVERPGWTRQIAVTTGGSRVIAEQIRTVLANRFRRPAPEITLAENDLAEVRHVLAQMLAI